MTTRLTSRETASVHENIEQRRLALLTRYDTRAPRYTSYPTALQFTPVVNANSYQAWLRALPVEVPVSLYIHVPFCQRLCWYCGCNTRAVNNKDAISSFVGELERELDLLTPHLPGRLKVGQLHFGGGTPNILSPNDMTWLMAALLRRFDFEPEAEIAAELDPVTLEASWIDTAAGLGMNRASLGVQTLSPAVQEAVNRPLSLETVASAVERLRANGVGSINLDVMYGLPRQTTGDVLSTLEQLATLRPERLALFGYAHVPWAKAHQKLIRDEDLAGAADRLATSETASAFLLSLGYHRLGLDHFALPEDPLAIAARSGSLRRNFQGYTADPCATLVGIGPSAIGSLPQGYVQNHTGELEWRKAVNSGTLPVARGVTLTPEDRMRAEVIERIMCDLRVDLKAIAARHGLLPPLGDRELSALEDLEADGIVVRQGSTLAVTEVGRPFIRSLALVFDQHSVAENRYSRAV